MTEPIATPSWRAPVRIRPLLTALALLSASVHAGCDDAVSAPDVAGRYELESVNGDPVPYRWSENTFTEEWLDAASVTLRRDGGFLYVAEWRTTYANGNPDTRTTFPLEGTYRVRAGAVTFYADGDEWASGSLPDGSLLTLIGENFVEHVFRK